jgi:acyl-homoserine-lactone acylase
MKKPLLALALITLACTPPGESADEVARWEARAEGVTIIRDDWGVPHIYGETDADAVFGLMYAQAEDDFNRIEVNFLNSQGRLAEAEGEGEIWRDLRMKLFIDPVEMRAMYADSPDWLKALMDGWADGLNYYLYTHPDVRPRVLTRFEPWMALSFSEGSIGGDIERVNLARLEDFYGDPESRMSAVVKSDELDDASGRMALARPPIGQVASALVEPDPFVEPEGSNGFAIAPANTVNGNALLLINPHTSFFFRHEAHMVSEQGLNAYGALTWGQFFVYQGFNETTGWMHTSSGVDNIDEYLETVVERDGQLVYLYGDEERTVETRTVVVPYKTDTGMADREFTIYRTHHGPIVRAVDGRWVSVALMEEPMHALIQSYNRTRARNYETFVETMSRHTNSSNNTVFADADGNIAYFHSNFIPVRDTRFNWLEPVDGSDPATDWQGVHTLEQTPGSHNPSNGWIQNTNNWPFSVSGPTSPDREDFPVYVQRSGENARGLHAIRVLEGKTDFTVQGLIDAAYDSYMTWFEPMIPALLGDYDALSASDSRKTGVADQIALLRDWDLRWGVESIETSLAIFWADALMRQAADVARGAGVSTSEYIATPAAAGLRLEALAAATDRLVDDFGSWRTPWGEINRFQRLTGDIVQPFNDEGPSTPVGFASSRWGSLASFGARRYEGTKRWYGTSGNSFVAVVEFGDRLRARAVTAGGLNDQPSSPHFDDQTDRYATGDLREVRFYREDVAANAEREYRPGG